MTMNFAPQGHSRDLLTEIRERKQREYAANQEAAKNVSTSRDMTDAGMNKQEMIDYNKGKETANNQSSPSMQKQSVPNKLEIGDEPLLDIFARPTPPEYDEKRQNRRKAQGGFNALGSALTAMGDQIAFSKGARVPSRDYSGHKKYIEDFMRYQDEHADKLQAFKEKDYERKLRESMIAGENKYRQDALKQRAAEGQADKEWRSGESEKERQFRADQQRKALDASARELSAKLKAQGKKDEDIKGYIADYSEMLDSRDFLNEFRHLIDLKHEKNMYGEDDLSKPPIHYGIPKGQEEALVNVYRNWKNRQTQMKRSDAMGQVPITSQQRPDTTQSQQAPQALPQRSAQTQQAQPVMQDGTPLPPETVDYVNGLAGRFRNKKTTYQEKVNIIDMLRSIFGEDDAMSFLKTGIIPTGQPSHQGTTQQPSTLPSYEQRISVLP
jgi:hypothetical protein